MKATVDQESEEWPDQVELLLNREAPQMVEKWRATDRLEVREVGGDVPPIVDVERRGERVAGELVSGIAIPDRDDSSDNDEHQKQCWQ